MYIPFDLLPSHSRIWIYQSNKKLNQQQIDILSSGLRTFTENWLVHGKPMEASFDIRYEHFVIIGANDEASGCSIDNSVRTIKSIGDSLGLDFFDRNLVGFKNEEGLTLIALKDLKQSFEKGVWNGQLLTFNNLVNTKDELEKNWIVKAESTWLKRYIPQEKLIL